MNSKSGFAIDVPVTDLDDEVDDFDFNFEEPGSTDDNHTTGISSGYDEDNRSIDLNNLDFDNGPNVFQRTWRSFNKLFSKDTRFNHFNTFDNRYADDIELINRGHNNDSDYDFGVDFDFNKNKQNKFYRYLKAIYKSRLISFTFSLIIISLLITLIVLVSKQKKNNKPIKSLDSIEHLISDRQNDLFTILISIGSLHPHFISYENTPFLANMLNSSSFAYSPYMIPSNPSSHSTDLWSISTGLKNGQHGVISGDDYDKGDTLKKSYLDYTPIDKSYENITKIWDHADTVAINWPQSNNPNQEIKYKPISSQLEQIKEIVQTDKENTSPVLLLSYVFELAETIKENGLSGENLKKTLGEIDSFIKKTMDTISQNDRTNKTNVIIVSDGDLVPISNERGILLDDLVNINDIDRIVGSTVLGLYPIIEFDIETFTNDVFDNWEKHPLKEKFSVYRKDEISDILFDYEANMGPSLLFVPKAGYYFYSDQSKYRNYLHEHNKSDYITGYPNNEVLNRNVFMGTGPSFKTGLILKPFENIHIFSIVKDIVESSEIASVTFAENTENLIDYDWKDLHPYPGVDFNIEILQEESWLESKFGAKPVHRLINPLEPIVSIPYDEQENDSNDNKGEDDLEDSAEGIIESTPTDNANEINTVEGIITTSTNMPIGTAPSTAEAGYSDDTAGGSSNAADDADGSDTEPPRRLSWWEHLAESVGDAIEDIKEDVNGLLQHPPQGSD